MRSRGTETNHFRLHQTI